MRKLRNWEKKNGLSKILGSKAILSKKQYRIVGLGISITKIDFEKIKKEEKKLIIYNASICIRIKINSFFYLLTS